MHPAGFCPDAPEIRSYRDSETFRKGIPSIAHDPARLSAPNIRTADMMLSVTPTILPPSGLSTCDPDGADTLLPYSLHGRSRRIRSPQTP